MSEPEKDQAEPVVSFGPYRLDLGTGQLWRGKQEVRITPKAFTALRYFVDHPGQLVTKDDLFTAAWPQTIVTEATLASCIQELRSALRDDARAPRYIETVHRRGFRFIAAVTPTPPVVSGQLSVISQREEGREQRKEEKQQANDNGSLEPETHNPSPQPVQTLDVSVSSTQQPWLIRRFILMGLMLLVGIIAVVQYLALPTPTPQSPTPSPQPLSLPDKPSIIILPFTNLSGDPDQDYFSDGVTEVLTSTLSRLSSLFVIARTSAFTYKGKAAKVQDISREMGVQYVLEGSVLKTDDHIRIMAQLIDATTGYSLWSERYDRPLRDIFAIQEEIVQKIVTTLKLQLTLQEQGYIVRKRTDNVAAYDSFLRGVEYFVHTTKETNAQARQLFEKAIALDSQYAEAYVLLGFTYYIEWLWRWSQDPHTLEQGLAMSQRAVALDDSLPGAHGLLGMIYTQQKLYDQALAASEPSLSIRTMLSAINTEQRP